MTTDQLLLITLSGVGTIIFSTLTYFLRSTMSELKKVVADNIDLKERVSLLELKSSSDLNHLALITNQKLDTVTLEINHLNGNVKQYMNNINTLVKATENNTFAIANLIKVSEKHENKFESLDEALLEIYKEFKK